MVTATSGPKGDLTDRLWGTLESYLEAEGVELDDLEVRGGGNGRIVRITVDATDGVAVGRMAELSRGIARLLDESDPVDGAYTLEVTSPGLERSLRRPRHYEKAIGRELDVRTKDEVAGTKRHRGVLEGIGEQQIQLAIEGETRTIPLPSVTQARTIFQLKKAPKPGGKR